MISLIACHYPSVKDGTPYLSWQKHTGRGREVNGDSRLNHNCHNAVLKGAKSLLRPALASLLIIVRREVFWTAGLQMVWHCNTVIPISHSYVNRKWSLTWQIIILWLQIRPLQAQFVPRGVKAGSWLNIYTEAKIFHKAFHYLFCGFAEMNVRPLQDLTSI